MEKVREDLKKQGIDTGPTKEKIRTLLEQAKARKQADVPANSQSPALEIFKGVKDGLAAAAQAGQKIADHVQETANALAVGLTDFFVTSPFGRLQSAPMRGGSGTSTTLKLRIATLGVRVTFRLKGARGETIFASVVSLNDAKVSHILDGGTVINGGNVVGRFADGYAEFAASALAGQFGLRDSQGIPLEPVVENAS